MNLAADPNMNRMYERDQSEVAQERERRRIYAEGMDRCRLEICFLWCDTNASPRIVMTELKKQAEEEYQRKRQRMRQDFYDDGGAEQYRNAQDIRMRQQSAFQRQDGRSDLLPNIGGGMQRQQNMNNKPSAYPQAPQPRNSEPIQGGPSRVHNGMDVMELSEALGTSNRLLEQVVQKVNFLEDRNRSDNAAMQHLQKLMEDKNHEILQLRRELMRLEDSTGTLSGQVRGEVRTLAEKLDAREADVQSIHQTVSKVIGRLEGAAADASQMRQLYGRRLQDLEESRVSEERFMSKFSERSNTMEQNLAEMRTSLVGKLTGLDQSLTSLRNRVVQEDDARIHNLEAAVDSLSATVTRVTAESFNTLSQKLEDGLDAITTHVDKRVNDYAATLTTMSVKWSKCFDDLREAQDGLELLRRVISKEKENRHASEEALISRMDSSINRLEERVREEVATDVSTILRTVQNDLMSSLKGLKGEVAQCFTLEDATKFKVWVEDSVDDSSRQLSDIREAVKKCLLSMAKQDEERERIRRNLEDVVTSTEKKIERVSASMEDRLGKKVAVIAQEHSRVYAETSVKLATLEEGIQTTAQAFAEGQEKTEQINAALTDALATVDSRFELFKGNEEDHEEQQQYMFEDILEQIATVEKDVIRVQCENCVDYLLDYLDQEETVAQRQFQLENVTFRMDLLEKTVLDSKPAAGPTAELETIQQSQKSLRDEQAEVDRIIADLDKKVARLEVLVEQQRPVAQGEGLTPKTETEMAPAKVVADSTPAVECDVMTEKGEDAAKEVTEVTEVTESEVAPAESIAESAPAVESDVIAEEEMEEAPAAINEE